MMYTVHIRIKWLTDPLFPHTLYGQEYADTDADPDPDTDIWNSILTMCTMMV